MEMATAPCESDELDVVGMEDTQEWSGAAYHRRRLLSLVFGQWIRFTQQEIATREEAEEVAVTFAQYVSFLNGLTTLRTYHARQQQQRRTFQQAERHFDVRRDALAKLVNWTAMRLERRFQSWKREMDLSCPKWGLHNAVRLFRRWRLRTSQRAPQRDLFELSSMRNRGHAALTQWKSFVTLQQRKTHSVEPRNLFQLRCCFQFWRERGPRRKLLRTFLSICTEKSVKSQLRCNFHRLWRLTGESRASYLSIQTAARYCRNHHAREALLAWYGRHSDREFYRMRLLRCEEFFRKSAQRRALAHWIFFFKVRKSRRKEKDADERYSIVVVGRWRRLLACWMSWVEWKNRTQRYEHQCIRLASGWEESRDKRFAVKQFRLAVIRRHTSGSHRRHALFFYQWRRQRHAMNSFQGILSKRITRRSHLITSVWFWRVWRFVKTLSFWHSWASNRRIRRQTVMKARVSYQSFLEREAVQRIFRTVAMDSSFSNRYYGLRLLRRCWKAWIKDVQERRQDRSRLECHRNLWGIPESTNTAYSSKNLKFPTAIQSFYGSYSTSPHHSPDLSATDDLVHASPRIRPELLEWDVNSLLSATPKMSSTTVVPSSSLPFSSVGADDSKFVSPPAPVYIPTVPSSSDDIVHDERAALAMEILRFIQDYGIDPSVTNSPSVI